VTPTKTIERTVVHRGDPVDARTPALRCLIVDDQPTTLEQLAWMLRVHPSVRWVSTAADATEALRALRHAEVDVAFIEAGLPGMDGMELARVLKRFRAAPALVFVTRHPERAAEAFDLGAVDYVTKPARPNRLAESLRRVTAARQAANLADFAAAALWPGAAKAGANSMAVPGGADTDDDAIPVELGGTTKLVPRSSVRWVEARGDYARLHTSDGSHLIRARLTALADCWRNAGWIRIHRSYLVQLRCIADVRVADSKQMTVVVDGHQLPVSRRLAPKLRNRLLNAARMTTLATT